MTTLIKQTAALPFWHLQENRWLQMLALAGVWVLGDWVARTTRVPLPGGVIGMFALILVLLRCGVSLKWVKRGASSLIDNLALFFIPAMVAFVGHHELFGWLGVKMIIAVLAGTVSVMVGTAIMVELYFRWRSSRVI